jgi:DNA-binding transcriptional ArsR family regulator
MLPPSLVRQAHPWRANPWRRGPAAAAGASTICGPKKSQRGLTPAADAVIFNQVVKHPAEPLSRVFFALSDPTRRAILARVAGGQVTVTAIAAPFAMSLAAVSKHIRVLELAGLLERSRQGREHRLRLLAAPLRDAADWVEGFREFWTEHLDSIKELAERKARERARQNNRPKKETDS